MPARIEARSGEQFGYSRPMPRAKVVFVCESCGAQQPKWQGQCPDCGAWNSLTEGRAPSRELARASATTGEIGVTRLDRLDASRVSRVSTGLGEVTVKSWLSSSPWLKIMNAAKIAYGHIAV